MGGPLLSCAVCARMLSLMWKIPIIGVNHCVGTSHSVPKNLSIAGESNSRAHASSRHCSTMVMPREGAVHDRAITPSLTEIIHTTPAALSRAQLKRLPCRTHRNGQSRLWGRQPGCAICQRRQHPGAAPSRHSRLGTCHCHVRAVTYLSYACRIPIIYLDHVMSLPHTLVYSP